MAAPILELIALPTTGATIVNLTTASGGLSSVNGINGSDWLLTDGNHYKMLGERQIYWAPFVDAGSGAIPGVATTAGYRTVAYENADDRDGLLGGTGTSSSDSQFFGNNDGAQINCGAECNLNANQNLRRYVAMFGMNGGIYTVTASLANAELAPVSITIDARGPSIYGANDGWFACRFRSVQPTTLNIKIKKTAVQQNGVGLGIWSQASYIEPNVKPAVGSFFKTRLFRG